MSPIWKVIVGHSILNKLDITFEFSNPSVYERSSEYHVGPLISNIDPLTATIALKMDEPIRGKVIPFRK